MFTGLIHHLGHVTGSEPLGSGGLRLQIAVAGLDPTPIVGDSIAIEGCCLTVSEAPQVEDARCVLAFEAVPQTLQRTTLGALRTGDVVHLEPAMRVGEPLGGHLVQGHVDCTAEIIGLSVDGADHRVRLALEPETARLVMLRGSVCLAGVSLTVADRHEDGFSVVLIPTR
jgi:riboflavin synthase